MFKLKLEKSISLLEIRLLIFEGREEDIGTNFMQATGFNFDGSKFAYAVSYDWSEGFTGHRPESPNWIGIHTCLDEDVKPRPLSLGRR